MKKDKRTLEQQLLAAGRNPKHPEKKLVSRRDFLSSGAMSFAATAMLPTAASMILSSRALASDGGSCDLGTAPSTMIPFIFFDCAGGAALPGNWVVKDAPGMNGQPLGDMTALGLIDQNKFIVNTDFGAPMAQILPPELLGDIESKIFAQLFALDPAIKSKIRMGTVCHSSLSDSGDNLLNAAGLISATGLKGKRISNGLGARSTRSTGNSSLASFDPQYRPMGIASVDSLSNALSYGPALMSLPTGARDAMAKAVLNMSAAQSARFNSMNLGSALAAIFDCGSRKNALVTSPGASVDARQDATASTIYGITAGTAPNDSNAIEATLVMNCLKGNSGPTTITIGGCDYHSGNRTDGDNKDTEIGMHMAKAFQLAAALGVPFAFQVSTDGGISSVPGSRNWQGDDNDHSLTVFGVYDPNGARSMVSTQIGRYTAGQSADRSFSFAADPEKVAHIVLVNYLSLHNKTGMYASLSDISKQLQGSLDQYRLF